MPPPWIPLEKVTIYHGSTIVKNISLDSNMTDSLRYDDTVTLSANESDSFFVVFVSPAGAGTPVLGYPSGSFTNAILYDRDGDGEWMNHSSD